MAGVCQRVYQLSSRTPFASNLIFKECAALSFTCSPFNVQQIRGKTKNIPKLKFPLWYLKKERVQYPEFLTSENKGFIKEITYEKYGPPALIHGVPSFNTPLKEPIMAKGVWEPKSRRSGLIARKIGSYPMWKKDGKIIWTTLLQVVDNHVVKYTPPEEVDPPNKPNKFLKPNKFGVLLIGSESCDPQQFTKEYCGLFSSSGLPPKRILARFMVTPNAAIQPGTPLFANHFQPGDIVDVSGKTIDRGFQGVMKRWGFKGMPASHGVTKTHRRGGNIGAGGNKARVWPGTKMPGHMGNKRRVLRGLKIWRVNTKYNVLYVQGLGIPGETNSVVHIYDTLLPLRIRKEAPAHFPTYFPDEGDSLPEDLCHPDLHPFDGPTIEFKEEKS